MFIDKIYSIPTCLQYTHVYNITTSLIIIFVILLFVKNGLQFGLKNCTLVSNHFLVCVINLKPYHFYLILHAFGI